MMKIQTQVRTDDIYDSLVYVCRTQESRGSYVQVKAY